MLPPSSLEVHRAECPMRVAPCPNAPGCTFKGPLAKHESHRLTCNKYRLENLVLQMLRFLISPPFPSNAPLIDADNNPKGVDSLVHLLPFNCTEVSATRLGMNSSVLGFKQIMLRGKFPPL